MNDNVSDCFPTSYFYELDICMLILIIGLILCQQIVASLQILTHFGFEKLLITLMDGTILPNLFLRIS